MALDKRQIDAIEMLIEGEKTRTKIAELVGITRKGLYDWFENDEFVKEWDRRLQETKTLTHKGFDAKLEKAKDKLWEIICSDADIRTREKALEYWINRSIGSPTNKTETTINESNDNPTDTKQLIEKYKQKKREQQQSDNEDNE